MMSEEQIFEAIEEARKNGSVTFISSEPKKDRAKVYRTLDKQKESALPLFPNEDRFEVNINDKYVTIKRKKENSLLIVPTPGEVPKIAEKPKKVLKKPDWLTRYEEKHIDGLEKQLEREKEQLTPAIIKHWREYLDTQRIAIAYYLETKNDDFIDVIKPPKSGDFLKYVMLAFFGTEFTVEPKSVVSNKDKRLALIERRGEYINDSTHEGQRMLQFIDDELERLRKAIDEEDARKSPL